MPKTFQCCCARCGATFARGQLYDVQLPGESQTRPAQWLVVRTSRTDLATHGTDRNAGRLGSWSLTDYPSVAAPDAQAHQAVAESERARGAYWPTIGIAATAAAVWCIPSNVTAEFHARTAREELAQVAAETFLASLGGHELAELARAHLAALTAIQTNMRGSVGLDPGRISDLLPAVTRVDAARLNLSQQEAHPQALGFTEASVAARHFGGRSSLVDEEEALGFEVYLVR